MEEIIKKDNYIMLNRAEIATLRDFIEGFYQSVDKERTEAAVMIVGILDYILSSKLGG